MNFNSLAFLIYLPVVVIIYWLLPNKARQVWLLAASYFFYMYWNPLLIILLLASTAVDYCCGRGMEHFHDNEEIRKLLLLCSMCMNLGLLFFFKYFDFFAENMNQLFLMLNIPRNVEALNLILPVGISFYTFQTMSYTIDVYRGDAPAEKNPITFALYVTYFPQLVAGPIENPKNLMPQLKAEHHFNSEDFTAGVQLLLSGFFRKCVVADFCGLFVNAVYADLDHANGLAIIFAGTLFCFQMYCDFAGYSEIAAGAARIMGVRLMKNFNQPYLSQSYGEFFRRWHISLNRWFTSYLYIPLGGSRKGTARKIINTLIVFTLCGLWHGARWTYVLWGLYAAVWVCIESVILPPLEKGATNIGINLKDPLVQWIRRGYMFLIFLPASLMFRAESLEQIKTIYARIFSTGFSFQEATELMGINLSLGIQLIITLIAMAYLPKLTDHNLALADTSRDQMERCINTALMVIIIACCWIALSQSHDMASFAYFQF